MLISFEGPEGSGKSTAIQALGERLLQMGKEVVTTREPGAGPFGAQIRKLLLDGEEIDARTELLLFLADRANHVAHVIRPAIEAGKIVLCDRYTDSSIAYQGYALGLDIDFIRRANAFSTGNLPPDFTILFDVDPLVGLARLSEKDRLDRKPLEFHQRVRLGFLREAHMESRRWIIMDASRSPDVVLESVLHVVVERLGGD